MARLGALIALLLIASPALAKTYDRFESRKSESSRLESIKANVKTESVKTESAKIESGRAERGIASMYATSLVGHHTASGQVFDSKRLTAAHRSLPFGTAVEVTNKKNGRKVIVTVNDRGPHLKGRIIDLSPAAASELGMKRAGLAQVEIRVAAQQR